MDRIDHYCRRYDRIAHYCRRYDRIAHRLRRYDRIAQLKAKLEAMISELLSAISRQ